MKIVKNKKVLIILSLVIIIGGLFALKLSKNPSDEMLSLRKVEQQLNLPVPVDRIENDLGENSDYKGAKYYTRNILLYYDDQQRLESALDKLTSSGWKQVNHNVIGDYKSYKFVNSNSRTCLSAKIDPASEDPRPHNIYLSSALDNLCEI